MKASYKQRIKDLIQERDIEGFNMTLANQKIEMVKEGYSIASEGEVFSNDGDNQLEINIENDNVFSIVENVLKTIEATPNAGSEPIEEPKEEPIAPKEESKEEPKGDKGDRGEMGEPAPQGPK